MTPLQKQERREKIMGRLMRDLTLDWFKIQNHVAKQPGTLTVKIDSPEYYLLKTHPRNKDRVDAIIESTCQGFLGYKK